MILRKYAVEQLRRLSTPTLDFDVPVSGDRWDKDVESLGGTAFHSSAWAEFTARSRANSAPVFVRSFAADGRLRGAALGFLSESPNPLMAAVTRSFRIDAAPAGLTPGQELAEFYGSLERTLRRAGVSQIVVGSFGLGSSGVTLDELGYRVAARVEWELDLRMNEDQLTDGLERQRRNKINKAKKHGIVVEALSVVEGLPLLNELNRIAWIRISARGGVRKGEGGALSSAAVQALVSAGVGRLIGARAEREWVAVGFFAVFGTHSYFMTSGHSPEGLKLSAPSLLLWESALRFKSEGVTRFNLGGVTSDAQRPSSPEHGVMLYKRAFGGVEIECVGGEKVLNPFRFWIGEHTRRLSYRF